MNIFQMLKLGVSNNVILYDCEAKTGVLSRKLIDLLKEFMSTEFNDGASRFVLDADHWLFDSVSSDDPRVKQYDGIYYAGEYNLTNQYLLLGGEFGQGKEKVVMCTSQRGNVVLGMY